MARRGIRNTRFRKCGNSWTYGRIFGSVAAKGLREKRTEERTALGLKEDTPVFFVSVASKRVSTAVSLLFATVTGKFISVAAKGLMRTKRWRESDGFGLEVWKHPLPSRNFVTI